MKDTLMDSLYNFDDIRPYNDSEASEKIHSLISNPAFDKVLLTLFKQEEVVAKIKMQLSQVQTIGQLQGTFIYDLLTMLLKKTTQGLTSSGLEKLDKNQAYLFISNHRDIIMDSAFLNFLVFENGMNTTQIAIGDNLLIYDWITHAVKLNRAFVVKRSLPPRELLKASSKLSEYIRRSITKENISVWIAQREGRTKNGSDQTQASLLKMLNMSAKNGIAQGFTQLNIVPLSISYEIEPCGNSKIKEVIERQFNGYQKTIKDDLQSMAAGFLSPKGRIHYSFGEPLVLEVEEPASKEKQNKLIEQVAELIDQKIYAQFKLWPNNYIAYDQLFKQSKFSDFYSEKDQKRFNTLLQQALKSIDESEDLVTETFLKLYANPVINALSVKAGGS